MLTDKEEQAEEVLTLEEVLKEDTKEKVVSKEEDSEVVDLAKDEHLFEEGADSDKDIPEEEESNYGI